MPKMKHIKSQLNDKSNDKKRFGDRDLAGELTYADL